MPLFFEDYEALEPGHSWRTGARTITQADIDAFARTTGDDNPIHLDAEQARRNGYAGTIAHGYMTMGWAAGLVHRLDIDRIASAAILETNWRLLDVVNVGDAIHVVLSLLERRESRSKPDYGIVTRQFDVFAGTDRKVAEGRVTILVLRRGAAGDRGLLSGPATPARTESYADSGRRP